MPSAPPPAASACAFTARRAFARSSPANPTPPAPAAAAPAPPAPPPRPAPPEAATTVNIGGERDQEALQVTGDNVVPPRPDARIHNRPPAYPAAAARRHAEGVVGLLIHVTELGIPGWVEIAKSSGDPDLDQAAQEAVSLWHFQPARSGGTAIPFDLPFSVHFTMDARR